MPIPINLKVIIGSTRPGRFGDKPARWVLDAAKQLSDVNVELLDLRDYAMPFLDIEQTPSMGGRSTHEAVGRWAQKIEEADAFVIVTPEYNHGYPAVLKNALDHLFAPWAHKAVGFVSYGSVGGARAVEQLRQVAVELRMTPVREAVHIPWDIYLAAAKTEPGDPTPFAPLRTGRTDKLQAMLDDVLWHARALKAAR